MMGWLFFLPPRRPAAFWRQSCINKGYLKRLTDYLSYNREHKTNENTCVKDYVTRSSVFIKQFPPRALGDTIRDIIDVFKRDYGGVGQTEGGGEKKKREKETPSGIATGVVSLQSHHI